MFSPFKPQKVQETTMQYMVISSNINMFYKSVLVPLSSHHLLKLESEGARKEKVMERESEREITNIQCEIGNIPIDSAHVTKIIKSYE